MDAPASILIATTSLSILAAGIGAGWLVGGGLLAWRRMVGVAALALMGVGISTYLGIQHHPDMGASVCTVSATIDCDRVNRSAASELGGVPIAFIGTAYYAAACALALLAMMRPEKYRLAGHALLGTGALAVVYSLFLTWVSYTLGAICPFCVALYGINLLICGGGWLAVRETDVPTMAGIAGVIRGSDDGSRGPLVGVGIGALALCLWGYSTLGAPAADPADPTSLARLMERPKGALTLDGTEPMMGDPSAKYTVVEFADFQCPSCARIAPGMHELAADHPELKVLFKHYPISGLCNPLIEGPAHENACAAAAAAECARQQGRFWELSRLMFKNQSYLDADSLRFMVEQVGLDQAEFERCHADPATTVAVQTDIAHANEVGLSGTPTLFLQGLEGDAWVQVHHGPEDVAALITAHQEGREIPEPAGGGHH